MSAALTLSQRFHFDAYGYVLLEDVLSSEEVTQLKDAFYRMKADPDLEAKRVYTRPQGDHLYRHCS